MGITYHDIRTECETLVSDAYEELGVGADEDAVRDHLQESIDGHEWVIYYNKAAQVCEAVSRGDAQWFNAAEDQLMDYGYRHESYLQLQTQLAYHVLSVRVFERLNVEVAV